MEKYVFHASKDSEVKFLDGHIFDSLPQCKIVLSQYVEEFFTELIEEEEIYEFSHNNKIFGYLTYEEVQ
jgi:hypothetical protein